MATTLAQVGITPNNPGWIATCRTCNWQSVVFVARPGADLAALDHVTDHVKNGAGR